MATRIAKVFRFEAAHRLPKHDGKCKQPHGHSYIVEVSLVGELQSAGSKSGMVMDFGDVTDVWRKHLEPLLDHRDLNVTLAGTIPHTTAELIAYWIHDRFRSHLGKSVERVRVYETATSYAEYPA